MEIIEEIVRQNLAEIGEDYDALRPFMHKWLHKVEEAIQTRKESQEKAIKTLKEVDYSVKSIANDVNASRTTMYNHEQLLRRYIERSASIAASTDPYLDIARLQNDKSILQEQINNLMLRDVDILLLKQENQNLSTTLEGKNEEIARLEERVRVLSSENQKLKADPTTAARSKVKSFPKK